jgi:hypothetical protein
MFYILPHLIPMVFFERLYMFLPLGEISLFATKRTLLRLENNCFAGSTPFKTTSILRGRQYARCCSFYHI